MLWMNFMEMGLYMVVGSDILLDIYSSSGAYLLVMYCKTLAISTTS